MTKAIHLEGVSKTYRKSPFSPQFAALKGVTLAVEKGESFGFIGPNGAGKSTTIKILTGGLQPSEGSASLFGLPVDNHQARVGLGYVPENPSLPDYLTPLEILRMGVRLHQVALNDERGHCMAWLARFELDRVANKLVRGFSKGMVQRTSLAHALAVKPKLLILDEPLSGLDPVGRRDVVDILADYRARGGTLFFSSHVLHDVERLADRYGLIHQGVLRSVSSPAELLDQDEKVQIRSQGGRMLDFQQAEAGGRWTVDCLRASVWAVLEAIKSADQTLIEVRPRLSLESAFMRAIETSRP